MVISLEEAKAFTPEENAMKSELEREIDAKLTAAFKHGNDCTVYAWPEEATPRLRDVIINTYQEAGWKVNENDCIRIVDGIEMPGIHIRAKK